MTEDKGQRTKERCHSCGSRNLKNGFPLETPDRPVPEGFYRGDIRGRACGNDTSSPGKYVPIALQHYGTVAILSLIFFVLASCLFAEENVEQLFKDADTLFFSYHENLGNLEKSIKIYEKIFEIDNKNLRSAVMISRAWLTYGDLVPEKKKDKQKAYEQCRDWAKKAREIDENSAQAHFWYFACAGRIQQLKGIITGLKMLPELKREIHKAYELNPKDVMILDGIGTFYYEVPRIMGGDLKKSEELLKKAVELDPNYTLAWYDLAVALYKQKKYIEARQVLERVLACQKPTYYADWITWDKLLAEKLIKEIDNKLE